MTPLRDKLRNTVIQIDFVRMTAARHGKPVHLTNQEFLTMRRFLETPEWVLTRRELLSEAWGYEHYSTTRTVDMCVANLRRKLGAKHFKTVHRVGYKFVP